VQSRTIRTPEAYLGEEEPMSQRPSKVDVSRRELLLDDFFKVEEAWLRFERYTGQMSDERRILHFDRGDSAAAVLHDPERDIVVLVEQFRYPTYTQGDGGWITELVAGMVGDERPEAAMRREILEETGIEVSALRQIAHFYLSPGGSSERVFLFYAEFREADRRSQGGGIASEDEDIRLVEISRAEALRRLQAGEIHDAKTLVGIQWLDRRQAE
jgi:nudix-type nucleoside diphosphatase (YffH/AdpP family)